MQVSGLGARFMGKPLRFLIIDDSQKDTLLLIRALENIGYTPNFERVDKADTLREMASKQTWDVVLCDSRMPTLSPEAALAICQQTGNDAPFIIVSGIMDDEEAVALLKTGAQDFIRKDNLARLGPAIERELREKAQRHKRRQAEQALQESQDRYLRLFKAAEISIWDMDLSKTVCALEALRKKGVSDLQQHLTTHFGVTQDLLMAMQINDVNDAALRTFGATSKLQLQQAIPRIFGDTTCHVFVDFVCAIWSREKVFRAEAQLHTVDNDEVSVILSLPLSNTAGSLESIPVSMLDITERRRAEQRLRDSEARLNYLAYHDTLTNLPNRLLFQDRLQHAMSKARRAAHQVAILFMDLDRFKTINDSLGHEVGDRFLQVVAQRLHNCMRQGDTVARLGGDEFVVILEQFKDMKEIVLVAQKILQTLSLPTTVKNHELSVTTSIGICLYPGDSEDVEGLMRCADMAMYRAKERSRNNYQFYSPEMGQDAVNLLLLEGDLRKAISHNQLVVHYQPQFDLTNRRLIGMEALVRWQHPRRGIIGPAEFVPLAEETGLIVAMGEWVMRTACLQNKAWQEAGYAPFSVAVNLSGRQFGQKCLVQTVDQILSESGLAPQYLELELTETAVMNDAASAIAALSALGRMGVKLAIDDFGTGYSSLSYLKRFPIHRLKIDRSFVRDCTVDANDAAIVSAIIALARSMDFEVIAEGVETAEQLRFLHQEGANAGQGYLYSPPLPVTRLAKLLDSFSIDYYI
jgi:diguanylate cyclase (GGDEF)-like protein